MVSQYCKYTLVQGEKVSMQMLSCHSVNDSTQELSLQKDRQKHRA